MRRHGCDANGGSGRRDGERSMQIGLLTCATFTWDGDNGSAVTCDGGRSAHVTRGGLAQKAGNISHRPEGDSSNVGPQHQRRD